MRKRCARCGERDVWASFFELKDRCPRCGCLFVREDGWIALDLFFSPPTAAEEAESIAARQPPDGS